MWIAIVPAIVRTEPEPTPILDRRDGALDQERMRGQAEIVVRREIDDRLVIEARGGLLAIFKDAQRAMQTLAPQGVEPGVEEGKGIRTHCRQLCLLQTTPGYGCRWRISNVRRCLALAPGRSHLTRTSRRHLTYWRDRPGSGGPEVSFWSSICQSCTTTKCAGTAAVSLFSLIMRKRPSGATS